MKKTLFLYLLLPLGVIAQEKFAPAIKQGSILHYTIFADGQPITSTFSLDSVTADYIKVGWSIDQLGNGSWIMKNKSINNAVRGYWSQPTSGVQEELPDDQIVLLLSKTQWASLQKDNKLEFDQQSFTVKQPNNEQLLQLAGKNVDAFFLENPSGTTRIWVLNNAALPILLKIEGNTMGPDISLSSME